MVLTSRKKRPLNRETHTRDASLIIIFSEGEKTEKQYFESDLFGRSTRVQVKVFETVNGKSAPKYVLERFKQYKKTTDVMSSDQFWLVLDVDRWPEKQLSEVCAEAIKGSHGARLAISNPSFELWLYLHFNDWTNGNTTSSQVEQSLRTFNGGDNKSNLNIADYEGKNTQAIQRAITLDINPDDRWPSNPGTRVYKLVEAINSLLQVDNSISA